MKSFFRASIILALTIGTAQPVVAQSPSNQGDANGNQEENGPIVSPKTNMKFSEADPEDITNENFPDLIESFDYPNAEITDVVKAISELTGKNFIVDPQVRGKITIIAPSQITVAEAYKAFLSALAINGFTVVPYGNFLKIRSARNAQRDSIETYSGAYFPNTDQMITRIIKLKYISAEEVNKNLRILPSKDGEMVPYPPTNSIIISDYGSNIERVMKIINELDVPGFEEQLEVIRIKYAKATDIAELINQIVNKDASGASGGRSRSRVPRFRRRGRDDDASSENFSLVIPDPRTNSIIVVGNKSGIQKIRRLVGKLDFKLRPEDAGGVFVYYVRHGEAESIANTLNGIATESEQAQQQQERGRGREASGPPAANTQAVFGGDVSVTADKNTNSLIITASKQDYDIVKNLLAKLDIPRDQVFVKVVIMEMSSNDQMVWGLNYYKFDADSNGVGRIGFRGSSSIQELVSPESDSGAILGFGSGETFTLRTAAGSFDNVASLTGLIKFLKTNGNANILSTPQVVALDNEEATIEVGQTVPVGISNAQGAGGTITSSIQREDATIKLVLTPFISPDSDRVQMKINQQVKSLATEQVKASALAQQAVVVNTRSIDTQIVVNSGDTAVLGGLMEDQEGESVTKVPILGDIPLIGWLFKAKTIEKSKTNLMVFITPKILRSAVDSANLLSQKLDERLQYIQDANHGRDPYGAAIDALPRGASAAPESPMFETDFESEFTEEPAMETF